MGPVVAKDLYGALGDRIDGLQVRTPQSRSFDDPGRLEL
jgi:hypothetical protein